MGKQNQFENKEAAPVSQQVVTENNENRPVTYVVTRDGNRVSDKEYSNPNDMFLITEKKFWTKVSTKHSYGEKVEIVAYDPKKHRIW